MTISDGRRGRGSMRTAIALALLLIPAVAHGQVTFEYFQGTAFNLPTPLTIAQTGHPDISVTADYSVRPLDDIWYYAARLGYWRQNRGWIIELLHHKIYLDNPPADVASFEVTHGYNIVTLNRGWRRDQTMFLAGGGVVIPHTNSVVRGRERPIAAPYTFAGAAVQASVTRRFQVRPWLFASVEGKVTAAWARVPVADGHAAAPNVALHGLAGVGVQF